MVIDFIIVKETKLGLAPKARVEFQVRCVDTIVFLQRNSEHLTDISWTTLASHCLQKIKMTYLRSYVSMPLKCIVASETDDESRVIIKFKLTTGVHLDDDKATYCDSFQEPFLSGVTSLQTTISMLKEN